MRENYLKKMGITAWYSRTAASISPRYFHATLQNTDKKPVGVIIAVVDDTVALSEQTDLLKKIGNAITPDVTITVCDQLPALDYCQFIILLGLSRAKVVDIFKGVVVESVSLCDLMQDMQHKKILWSAIKPLRLP